MRYTTGRVKEAGHVADRGIVEREGEDITVTFYYDSVMRGEVGSDDPTVAIQVLFGFTRKFEDCEEVFAGEDISVVVIHGGETFAMTNV